MDVWGVYVFILCLCCPVFRKRPCDELITRPRSPTVCKNDHETVKAEARAQGGCTASEKKKRIKCSTLPAIYFSATKLLPKELQWERIRLKIRRALVLSRVSTENFCKLKSRTIFNLH
jgi:hypothetical protein